MSPFASKMVVPITPLKSFVAAIAVRTASRSTDVALFRAAMMMLVASKPLALYAPTSSLYLAL